MKLFLWFQILNNLKQLLLLERGELQTLKTERTKIKEQKDEQYIKIKLVYVGGGAIFTIVLMCLHERGMTLDKQATLQKTIILQIIFAMRKPSFVILKVENSLDIFFNIFESGNLTKDMFETLNSLTTAIWSKT